MVLMGLILVRFWEWKLGVMELSFPLTKQKYRQPHEKSYS
jgi:hypothetical protein